MQDIAAKALSGRELTQDELFHLHAVLLVLVRHLEAAHYQYKLGLVELGKLKVPVSLSSVHLASEQGRRFWNTKKSAHDADFVAFVDRLVDSAGDPKARMTEFGLTKI